MRKTNYFKAADVFKSNCQINYRLSIIPNYEHYILFDRLYYIDGRVELYRSPEELIEYFQDTIQQKAVDILHTDELMFCSIIENNKYAFGLYETAKLPNNKFPPNVNNYNSIIVYGYEQDDLIAYCNTSLKGSENISIPTKQFKEIICHDLSLSKNSKENDLLGYPLSTFDVTFIAKKHTLQDIENYLERLYSYENNRCNCNIFKIFYNTNMYDFRHYEYSGQQYQCAVNLRIIKDIFVYQNMILKANGCFLHSIIEANEAIIKHMTIITSLYAKYIYTLKSVFIDHCLLHIEQVLSLLEKNKSLLQKKGNIK